MGSLTPLMHTTTSKQQSFGTYMTKSFYDVHSTTKTTALPTTSTISRRLRPICKPRVQSITSLRFHDVSERSDIPKTSSQQRACGGNKGHMAGYFPLVMGKTPLLWLDNLLAECITS
jgi:hypothetical protein